MQEKNKKGFTLLELLVVVTIVSILASVSISSLSGYTQKARMSEGEAGLGTVRTAMRRRFVENNGAYPALAGVTPDAANVGINTTDLDGRFFVNANYLITSPKPGGGNTTFCARVTGATGTAPAGNRVNGLSRSIDERGNLYSSNDCSGTSLN